MSAWRRSICGAWLRRPAYIVYRHNDIGREHLHIVSVRVDETGRAISDSYEHGRSMKVCRELERQFGLVPATPKQWKEGLPLSPVGYGDGNLKGQLAGVIRRSPGSGVSVHWANTVPSFLFTASRWTR